MSAIDWTAWLNRKEITLAELKSDVAAIDDRSFGTVGDKPGQPTDETMKMRESFASAVANLEQAIFTVRNRHTRNAQ